LLNNKRLVATLAKRLPERFEVVAG